MEMYGMILFDSSMVMFARGRLAFYFGYSWDIIALRASNPELSFSIYPVPHILGREQSIASYWVEGVSVKSPHQKEAMEFIKFLAQKKHNKNYLQKYLKHDYLASYILEKILV